ncbi:MAG: TolC family protein, partial [Acidobacteriota bacterium]
ALQTALENRPDLMRLRASIENYDLDLTYSRNQLLPELTLRASYWSPGISGNQILYQGNNPLTNIIIGTIPGDSIDALKQAFDFSYRNWSVDLTLSIPVNALFGRAQLARAKLGLDQAKLRLEYQEQQVFLEIRNAVRSLETHYRRVVAYRAARELAEETLAGEEKKLQVGFSTNYQVLQYQRDLANASSQELRAMIDYNLSLAALDRATGTILQKNNIQTTALYDD